MYNKVDTKLDFLKNEDKILEFWEKNDIVNKGLKLNEGSDKSYTLYDGPPTANGKPHIGHLLTRVMKDIIPRYKSMKGYYIYRKAGWDTHGLPVEVEIEKKLGLNGKQDIEKYGVDKFIELCRNSVWEYKGMWEKFTKRIGYWVDMDNPYITYDNNYIESIFWSLKEMDKKGLIYKGHKISPYCPRCGTTLSKMEVENGDNYKILKENSVFVKFKSMEEENTYFIVWTTTPWTLPSNVALCMNPNETYVKLVSNGVNYIMLEKLVPTLFEEGSYTILSRKCGKEYEYHKYQPLFDYAKDEVKKGYFVVVDDYVTTEDGTGIVHIAPAFGEDDNKVCKKYDIDFVQLVDEAGNMSDKTDFGGMFVKKADKYVIEKLEREGKMFKVLPFEHSYPHCWRCKSPLLYYAKEAWFIKTTAIKDQMVENNNGVYWCPDHIKAGRMGNFLANNIDWGISRNRYWGTPLPFWTCECGHIHVMGSWDEIEKLTGVRPKDLHKPHLDPLTFPCPKCGNTMRRTPEVMDCWFDSGAMPFAQYHYPFENKEKFEKSFPADYISEAIDQTRGWFYTLQAVNTALFGKSPYKSCNLLGLVLDRNGLKMSKSLGNGIDPWSVLDKEGADGLRWYFYNNCVAGQGIAFNEDNLVELQRKFMGTLWNVYAFYVLYAEIDKIDPTKYNLKDCKLSFLDRWLLSEYNALVKFVTNCLDKLDMLSASRAMTEFVDKLSNWYVRRSRERFWGSEESDDKIAAYKTLYEVLTSMSRLLAPFLPFISEEIYQNLVRNLDKNAPESVHFASYPEADESMINSALNEGMNEVLEIVNLGRSCRSGSNVKNRQPLSKVMIACATQLKLDAELQGLIKDELNVENVEILKDADEYVSYELKPQLKTLGPKYGKQLGAIREYLAKVNPVEAVNKVRKGEKLAFDANGVQVEIGEEDLLIALKNKEGYSSETNGNLTVVLDTTLTEQLLEKGLVNEFVSKVQNLRKDSGLEVVNHIALEIDGDAAAVETLVARQNEFTKTLLADKFGKGSQGEFNTSLTFNGQTVNVYMTKM
ncbi:MAG: isoleucine--tRNA ligase [Clostridia bacterium]|nr:isoleucine--tRNA ligase [Clostridia bacterium]